MAKKIKQTAAENTTNPALNRLPNLSPRTKIKPVKKTSAKKPAPTKPKKPAAPKPVDALKKRISKPRKAHATRPTVREIPLIIQRQNIVWDLRGAKVSFRQIVKHLERIKNETTGKPKFASIGTSLATIFEDYQSVLDLQYKNQQLTVEQFVEAEINTLDGVEFEAQRQYKQTGEKEFGDLIINCVKERAKLRNLYKPKKIEIDARGALARLLGISEEELPDDSAAQ